MPTNSPSPVEHFISATNSLRQVLRLLHGIELSNALRQDLSEFNEEVSDYIDAVRVALQTPRL